MSKLVNFFFRKRVHICEYGALEGAELSPADLRVWRASQPRFQTIQKREPL